MFDIYMNFNQEKKNIWLELMVSQFHKMRRTGSLSVNIDVTNTEEVEILKEVLLLWGEEMKELEIVFKVHFFQTKFHHFFTTFSLICHIYIYLSFQNDDAPREEGDISGRRQKKWWDDEKPFPDAYFCVSTVRMYNFSGSSEEEFGFASRFVIQDTVIDKLMIETSAYPPTKKSSTEAKVAKLMKLPKGNDDFTIECF